ncbi:hypothetical protein ACFVIZ_04710 [Streptomyces anulatus]|uniref:hypothetical protein n=1 Tax=Streptomyces anulatus TaxID=1892 RepID=UPI00363DEA77
MFGGDEGADVVGEVGVGEGEVEAVDVADGGGCVVEDGSDDGRDGGGPGSEGAEDAQGGRQEARVRGGDSVECGGDGKRDGVGFGTGAFAGWDGLVG